jgi:hypothetical protein
MEKQVSGTCTAPFESGGGLCKVCRLLHHHHVEEGAGGFYDEVEARLGDDAGVQAQIAALPTLELPAYEDGPALRGLIDRLLVDTGITAGPAR